MYQAKMHLGESTLFNVVPLYHLCKKVLISVGNPIRFADFLYVLRVGARSCMCGIAREKGQAGAVAPTFS